MNAQKYVLLQPGGGERLRFLDDSVLVIHRAGGPAEGELAHYEYVAAPSAKGSPQHIHARHDETFYVAEGTFEFTLGSRTVVGAPGTFLYVPRGQPHGFRNAGTAKGRIVGTFGAGFAQYFRDLAAIIERTGAPPGREEWVELYGRYDTKFHAGG